MGVDYAGPIKFKATEKHKGKAYLVLYACSLTKALYLDLARSLQTGEFLLSLKGLIAGRGRPSKIYSDNGSTFIGTAAWIKQVQNDEKLNDFLACHKSRGPSPMLGRPVRAHDRAGQNSSEKNY